MANYFVGSGGSDANAGTSWALRKATLNGAEDIPVAAGDTVYVGAGTYRETLTCDVSGSSGNPITYIADVLGIVTDGVGGIVRVTASDNDQTSARTVNVAVGARNFRTFRGFVFSMASTNAFTGTNTDVIIEDCVFGNMAGAIAFVTTAAQARWTFRRCLARDGMPVDGIQFSHTSSLNDAGHVVENCLINVRGACVVTTRVGGIAVNHCTMSGGRGARVLTALAAGQTITVRHSIICGCSTAGVQATATGELVEDYNTFFANTADRTTVNTGANSVAYSPMLEMPIMVAGSLMPRAPLGALASHSPVGRLVGSGMSSDSLYGLPRPATDSKKSWGAVQMTDLSRETTTKRTGNASLRLGDAGRHQVYREVTAVSTTVSVYVQWEANYAGTKPSIVIKQHGQSDITVTATGSSGSWELLTHTWTPAAVPGFIIVELVSSNTATSGSYAVLWDDFAKTP